MSSVPKDPKTATPVVEQVVETTAPSAPIPPGTTVAPVILKPAYRKLSVWVNGLTALTAVLTLTTSLDTLKEYPVATAIITGLIAGINAFVHAIPGDSP